MLHTDIPESLRNRGIEQPQEARGFTISLDVAEPWGGGRIEGRVEKRNGRRDRRPLTVGARCLASWLDLPPQLVGQKRLLRLDTYWDIRMRAVPIWIDDEVWLERFELGTLVDSNWLHFAIDLPAELPRATEGTFVSFRWRIEAARARRIGRDTAALPLLLLEPRTIPTVRVETSPVGSWRLLEWRSKEERDGAGGPCSVSYEERRPEDMPLPGETPEQELRRRGARS
jgi:hypothetical protein